MALYLRSKAPETPGELAEALELVLALVQELDDATRRQLVLDPLFSYWLHHVHFALGGETQSLPVAIKPQIAVGGYGLAHGMWPQGIEVTSDQCGRIPLLNLRLLCHTRPNTRVRISLGSSPKDGEQVQRPHHGHLAGNLTFEGVTSFSAMQEIDGTNCVLAAHDWFSNGFKQSVHASFGDHGYGDAHATLSDVTEPTAADLDLVNRAACHLKKVWPEAFGLFSQVVSVVLPICGLVVGHSAPCFSRTVFVQLVESDLRNAENLLHEAGHCLLESVHAQGPLLTNSRQELYPSPWRADPRPLIGILHGSYVNLLVAILYKRSERLPGATSRVQVLQDELIRGLAVLRRHGKWTDMGEAVFTGIMEVYERELAD